MENCHDMKDLANLARLPVGDPRRGHLDACPRCRGLAEAQGLFLEPGATSDLDNLAGADAELQRRLGKTWFVPPVAARPRRRASWYGLAAVLALCAVGLATSDLLQLRGSEPRVGERVRGEETAGLVVTSDTDSVRVAWPDAPVLSEAGFFVFKLFDPGLETVGVRTVQRPDITETVTEMPPTAVFCQVFAVSHGDTVARSGIAALQPARE